MTQASAALDSAAVALPPHQLELSTQIFVPQLQQQFVLLDEITLRHRKIDDLAAGGRRKAGAAAGVNGAGAGVADGCGYRSALNRYKG